MTISNSKMTKTASGISRCSRTLCRSAFQRNRSIICGLPGSVVSCDESASSIRGDAASGNNGVGCGHADDFERDARERLTTPSVLARARHVCKHFMRGPDFVNGTVWPILPMHPSVDLRVGGRSTSAGSRTARCRRCEVCETRPRDTSYESTLPLVAMPRNDPVDFKGPPFDQLKT